MEPPILKKVHVGNLVDTITSEELSQFFGLSNTEYLKKYCSVELACAKGKDNNFAFINAPEQTYMEIMKLNGIELYGKKIQINDIPATDNTPTAQPGSTALTMLKKLFIHNIPKEVSASDISLLLGFSNNAYLKENTCVQIKTNDQGENFAFILTPSDVVDEIMKLNGVDFYGKNLNITEADEQQPTQQQQEQQQQQQQQQQQDTDNEILYMLLDCRSHPDLNYPPVREYEVCDALMKMTRIRR